MKIRFIGIFTSCLLWGSVADAQVSAPDIDPQDYIRKGADFMQRGISFHISVKNADEGSSTYNVFIKGDNMRLEISKRNKTGAPTVIIKNGKKNLMYSPTLKQARFIPNLSALSMLGIPEYKPAHPPEPSLATGAKEPSPSSPSQEEPDGYIVGAKTTKNGYACQMIINPKSKVEICLTDKYGIPSYVKKGASVLNYTKIKATDIENSLFKIPDDVVIIR